MKGGIKYGLLFILLALPACIYIFLRVYGENHYNLPVYYPVGVDSKGDSIYKTIPDFEFLNQQGEKVTRRNFEGKIYVTDFFFTTCKTICPKMSSNLNKVYLTFKDSPDVLFLSHTVDPETDSVQVLNDYAAMFKADSKKWIFVTGEKKKLYDIARNGYRITAMEGDGGPDDFIHSEKFVLVDKQGRIRGYYDGTDPKQVDKLITEIKVLKSEYKEKS